MNIANYVGDYEEQTTRLIVPGHVNIQRVFYRGQAFLPYESYWVDPNGESQYLTIQAFRDSQGVWRMNQKNSTPFKFDYETRNRECVHSDYYRVETTVSTMLALGYEVPKSARLAQHCAPSKRPVTVHWTGRVYSEPCAELPIHPYAGEQELKAPRRTYKAVKFPGRDMVIDAVTITPHLSR